MRKGFELPGVDGRARIAHGVILVAFLFLVLGFVRFQLIQSEELSLKSDENRLRVFPLMPPRGIIVDRAGKIIADNRPFYSVSLLPGSDDLIRRQLSLVAEVFPSANIDLEKLSRQAHTSAGHPVRVLERVSTEALAVLEEHRDRLPGLKIQSEPLRYYPHGSAMAHLVGYVGRVTQKEVDSSARGAYRVGDYVGRAGIEQQYDDMLRGKWGASYIEVDAIGREVGPFEGKELQRPIAGEKLELTIDLDLQLAVAALFPDEYRGAVVCMDPRNGEILALFSSPTYDPNRLSIGLSPREWKALADNVASPIHNRAVQSAYPPGSTFKTVTSMVAMAKGLFDRGMPEATCVGGMYFGRRRFGCWKEEGHGRMSFVQGLAQSCDVYFYKLGVRVGLEELMKGAGALGLGEKTGVDLPGEAAGLIPTREWYDRFYGPSNWGRGVIMNLAIGQGEILTTPLQLARVYSVVANGGTLVTPHVGKTGNDDSGVTLTVDLNIDFDLVRRALEEVVGGERGTGSLASVKNGAVRVSGKTGTAENPHGEDHALFVGYAPSEDPRIVCVVIVEESGHGGSVAAPIVGKILDHYFRSQELIATREEEHAVTHASDRLEG